MKKIFVVITIVIMTALFAADILNAAGGDAGNVAKVKKVLISWDDVLGVHEGFYVYFGNNLKYIYAKIASRMSVKTTWACVSIREDNYYDYFFIGVTSYSKIGEGYPAIIYGLYGNVVGGQDDGVPFWEAEVNWDDIMAMSYFLGIEVEPLSVVTDCKNWFDERALDDELRRYDLNGDGVIDEKDLEIVYSRLGRRVPPCGYLSVLCGQCSKKLDCSE